MEKLTIQELVRQIVSAIQGEATRIPDFDNGAIRLLFVPKCERAVTFLGGFGIDCEIDFVFAISETAKHIRPAGWRNEDRKECDCYGYSALKISGCSYALKHGHGRRSSDAPDECETWGRTNDRGCIVYDIYITDRFGPTDNPEPKPYFRLYISVSGADGFEDEKCALAAELELVYWCNNELEDDGFGHEAKYLTLVCPE